MQQGVDALEPLAGRLRALEGDAEEARPQRRQRVGRGPTQKMVFWGRHFFLFSNGNLFSLDITCVCGSLVARLLVFLPEVREFITRHTAYNKHDTGWAKGAPSEVGVAFSAELRF